jgi:hypothetical protein
LWRVEDGVTKMWTVFEYATEERGRAFWVKLRVLRERKRESCLILKFDKFGKAAFWAEILSYYLED